MLDDPRDRPAYRLAIAFLGLVVVAVVAGIAWVCAEHWRVKNIPNELWFMGGAIGGVFVGALIPFALRVNWKPDATEKLGFSYSWDWFAVLAGLILVFACVAAVVLGVHHHASLVWYAVAVTIGSVVLGLFIPSPARLDR